MLYHSEIDKNIANNEQFEAIVSNYKQLPHHNTVNVWVDDDYYTVNTLMGAEMFGYFGSYKSFFMQNIASNLFCMENQNIASNCRSYKSARTALV